MIRSLNLRFSLSGNKKGRMRGLQQISEAYTFIALLEGRPVWRVNNLVSTFPSDQTDLHDKRYICLTSPKTNLSRWQTEKRNLCLKRYKVVTLQSTDWKKKKAKVQSVALTLSKRSLEMIVPSESSFSFHLNQLPYS